MMRFLLFSFILHLAFFSTLSMGETTRPYGSPILETPYDNKYRKVETYLSASDRLTAVGYRDLGLQVQEDRVRHYLDMARRFRFQEEAVFDTGRHEDHWQLPFETEALGSGDCEDLAIWLYCRLLDEGFRNVRLTVGLAGRYEKGMHAWVTWYGLEQTLILDPSIEDWSRFPDQTEPFTYDPHYSYRFGERWRHR